MIKTIEAEGLKLLLSKFREKFREYGLRLTQFVLGMDGILHLVEVGAAIYEEAWATATLTGIHSLFFFIGVYLIGHDHTHHKGEHCDE